MGQYQPSQEHTHTVVQLDVLEESAVNVQTSADLCSAKASAPQLAAWGLTNSGLINALMQLSQSFSDAL